MGAMIEFVLRRYEKASDKEKATENKQSHSGIKRTLNRGSLKIPAAPGTSFVLFRILFQSSRIFTTPATDKFHRLFLNLISQCLRKRKKKNSSSWKTRIPM